MEFKPCKQSYGLIVTSGGSPVQVVTFKKERKAKKAQKDFKKQGKSVQYIGKSVLLTFEGE